jgi:hypothetical protein
MGVSAPVVLRLPPGHVHTMGFFLHIWQGLWVVKSNGFVPPPPSRKQGSELGHPGQAFRGRLGRPEHRAFFLVTRIEEAPHEILRSAPRPARNTKYVTLALFILILLSAENGGGHVAILRELQHGVIQPKPSLFSLRYGKPEPAHLGEVREGLGSGRDIAGVASMPRRQLLRARE